MARPPLISTRTDKVIRELFLKYFKKLLLLLSLLDNISHYVAPLELDLLKERKIEKCGSRDVIFLYNYSAFFVFRLDCKKRVLWLIMARMRWVPSWLQ